MGRHKAEGELLVSTKIKREKFLEAYEKSLGIVSTACKIAGISRKLYYEWVKNDEEFAEKIKHIEDKQIDFVESKLLENVNNNDTTAIIFFLKTKGRSRGYSERTEISGTLQIEQPLFG